MAWLSFTTSVSCFFALELLMFTVHIFLSCVYGFILNVIFAIFWQCICYSPCSDQKKYHFVLYFILSVTCDFNVTHFSFLINICDLSVYTEQLTFVEHSVFLISKSMTFCFALFSSASESSLILVCRIKLHCTGWAKKVGHSVWLSICLKRSICITFGTLQHCYVLNTSVNSILNKFITPVVPPSDKINSSVFHLQNQVRPLHSNAHILKILRPICTIFGTIKHRDILNMPITSFSSTA